MFNAGQDPIEFTVPDGKWGTEWRVVINTYEDGDHMSEEDGGTMYEAGAVLEVEPWTLVLLLRTSWRPRPPGTDADGTDTGSAGTHAPSA